MADEKNVQAVDDENLNVSGGSIIGDAARGAKNKVTKSIKWMKDNPGKTAALVAGKTALELGALYAIDNQFNNGEGFEAVKKFGKEKFGNVFGKKKNQENEVNESGEAEVYTSLDEND